MIVDLVVKFANENPTWGYGRIQGALANVGYHISDRTVGNILKQHGIEPAPDRKRQTTWNMFIKAHWDVLAAIDFTTIELWAKGGLVTFYLLFVMELKARRVHCAGCTAQPNETWMKQVARELTAFDDGFLNGKRYLLMDRDTKFCDSFRGFLDGEGIETVRLPPNETWMKQVARELTAFDDGFLNGKHYLLMDRDTKFCDSFRGLLDSEGIEAVRLPPKSPNLNAHLERFFGSLKSECLDRMIFFGEGSLRNAVRQFLVHYHGERNHQGLENRIIDAEAEVGGSRGEVHCRERLGGMLRYYHREAA